MKIGSAIFLGFLAALAAWVTDQLGLTFLSMMLMVAALSFLIGAISG